MSNCPRDQERLVAQAASLHDVHKCRACSGIWLPASSVIELIGKTKKPDASADLVLQGGLRCPDDGSSLEAVTRYGVEIDVCPCCGGVWLDGGELQRLQDSRKPPSKVTERVVDGAADFAGHAVLEAAFNPASYRAIGSVTEAAVEGAIELIGGILDGL